MLANVSSVAVPLGENVEDKIEIFFSIIYKIAHLVINSKTRQRQNLHVCEAMVYSQVGQKLHPSKQLWSDDRSENDIAKYCRNDRFG